ncbi:hypothetical protein DSO57_1038253 [Entomophthora muscae]|uniref:Uncharacterized protein n=1 Tax=Entomophthora muscae TaxID=34485 RepID=A0ACC2T9E4_9FUNG|nr:hypothetical protein DSO57_1038253 [Entomophthora muscae]
MATVNIIIIVDMGTVAGLCLVRQSHPSRREVTKQLSCLLQLFVVHRSAGTNHGRTQRPHNDLISRQNGHQGLSEEFSRLKEAIGMTDAKACYIFQKKLSPELKNFLAHHVLPDKFSELTKEVLKWSSKVKQLPS